MYSKALEKGKLLHLWEDGLRERTVFFLSLIVVLEERPQNLSTMDAIEGETLPNFKRLSPAL